MADGAELQIPDLQAYLAELRALPAVLQQRLMRGAVATGASVVRKASIALAPEWSGPVGKNHPPPGTLKKSIYQARVSDECTPTREVFKVDVRTGSKAIKKAGKVAGAYYAWMVERGHYTRTPSGAGSRKARREEARRTGAVRWVAPQPFMRPGFNNNQQAALDAMAAYIAERLPEATAAMQYIKAIGG